MVRKEGFEPGRGVARRDPHLPIADGAGASASSATSALVPTYHTDRSLGVSRLTRCDPEARLDGPRERDPKCGYGVTQLRVPVPRAVQSRQDRTTRLEPS